jgi:hypothetical protein
MGIYVSSNVLRRHDLYTSAAATCIIVSVFQCNLMRACRESGQPWDSLMEGFHWFVNNGNEAKSVNVWLASKSCTDSIASRRWLWLMTGPKVLTSVVRGSGTLR